MVQVGDKIGNYQVVRSLGSGAMGTVYEAQHEQIKSRVAVKILHPHFAQHSGLRGRFFQEAYTANRVNHPGVVSVFDHGQVGTLPTSSWSIWPVRRCTHACVAVASA